MRSFVLSTITMFLAYSTSACSAEKPDCGSKTATSYIENQLKKSYPEGIVAATLSNPEFQRTFLSSDREYGDRTPVCRAEMKSGINGWFASIGHPERIISDFEIGEMSLCQVPLELASTERQCSVIEDKLLSAYKNCMNQSRPTTKAFEKLENERQTALSKANYKLENIRTTSRDPQTGTVVCVASLRASLPRPWGELRQVLHYKVEETADHRLYMTAWE